MDIATWLQDLGLERYVPAFHDNEIDWEVLPKLTSEDLREIGVAAIGHRRKLLDAICRSSAPRRPSSTVTVLARDLVIPLALKASENDLGALDQVDFLGTAAGQVHQFRSLLGRTRQRHRNPGHATPQLVSEPNLSYKISHFNAIKH